jgi:pimeloyl-ACP methyl ester carboxylesterase
MPFVELGQRRVYYEQSGTGDPVVWLPGTGLAGRSWELQTALLGSSFRCITLDLPGSGRSSLPATATVSSLAVDVAATMDALSLGPAHLVGLSLGSAVAQEVALLRPDLVRSTVLVGTWSSTRREHHIRRHFESRLYSLQHGPLDVFTQFTFWMSSPTLLDEEPELQTVVEERLAAHTSRWPEGTASHFLADLSHETQDRLPQIACPTLIVHGDEDLITLPRYNQTVAAAVPDATLVSIPRAGHLVWLERPDEVTDALDSFLARQPINPTQEGALS